MKSSNVYLYSNGTQSNLKFLIWNITVRTPEILYLTFSK